MSTLFKSHWRNPITFIAVFILVTVILLIAANVLGFDKGETLKNLSEVNFARGLITYLFAVGTIGVIIIVILAILLSGDETDEKIKRAKDILTILIGLFGTIIGFYFGSQNQTSDDTVTSAEIRLAPLQIPDSIEAGQTFYLKSIVTGGTPPYKYWIMVDSINFEDTTEKIINHKINIPNRDNASIVIYVEDQNKNLGVSERDISSIIKE